LYFQKQANSFHLKCIYNNAFTLLTLDFDVASTLTENIFVSLVRMKKWPKLHLSIVHKTSSIYN